MDLKEGVVVEYDPHRDRSLEPLLEGITKSGKYIDESMFILRPNDTERIKISLPDAEIKKEKLWVTSHFVQRPTSGHEQIVKVYTGYKRIQKKWTDFVNQPAAPIYKGVESCGSDDVISNIMQLKTPKLLYSISSSNDDIVHRIFYENVLSITGCHGILRYLHPFEGVNTTTIYAGNVGTFFCGHYEDAKLWSLNQLINPREDH
jgi:hypothetical protein